MALELETVTDEPIDITFTRVAETVRLVLKGQPESYVEAAKTLALYMREGDTIRIRMEDVQSMTKHILHLRSQVWELQAVGTDLLEENRKLRALLGCAEEEPA